MNIPAYLFKRVFLFQLLEVAHAQLHEWLGLSLVVLLHAVEPLPDIDELTLNLDVGHRNLNIKQTCFG